MSISNSTLVTQPTAAGTLFTGGASGDVVTVIYLCNTSGSVSAFNLYVVPSGSVAGPSNIAYNTKLVAGNDTYVIDLEKIVLGTGDFIAANANTGTITATISTLST